MKGMELSRKAFFEEGLPLINNEFSDYCGYIAAGLAGQGSECLGFDDELSTDHDFGIDFCIWVPRMMGVDAYRKLDKAYKQLSLKMNVRGNYITSNRNNRIGVHSIEKFYESLIGIPRAPETNMEWLRIPEKFLASAVNGEVFLDNYGRFSKIRRELQGFYPEDVIKKKLAANLDVMAQSGQYNYQRCIKRGEIEAAYLACGEFVNSALAAVYLLNSRYMPFYKWAFRAAEDFESLNECVLLLRKLVRMDDINCSDEKIELIEQICIQIMHELELRGYSDTHDSFMKYHADNLMKGICDEQIKGLHIRIGGVCK